jgi:hypothetical protein
MNKKSSSRKTNIDYYNRKVKTRKWFLIVCEGEKTEPYYFKSFPVDPTVIKLDIKGEGKNTKSLVEKAIELKNGQNPTKQTDFGVCSIAIKTLTILTTRKILIQP